MQADASVIGLRSFRLSLLVAQYEIRSRYARSVLGSFWITLQQALFVGAAGIVFPAVFDVPLASYLPYFAVSLLFWNFMSSCILEAADTLSANGPMIKDRGFPPEIFLFASFFRNILISAHALPVPLVLIVVLQASSVAGFMLAIPGFLVFFITAAAVSYIVGVMAARYRDLKRLIESVLQIAFLVTPILWKSGFVNGRDAYVVNLNPLAHLFEAWRKPLLEGILDPTSLAVAGAVALLAVLIALACRARLAEVAIWI